MRRPCERRDSYAAASRFGTLANGFFSNRRRWLWVPAFAGTTWQLTMSQVSSCPAMTVICPSCQSAATGGIELAPKSAIHPRLSRLTGGAARDRHGRGTGCGGRCRRAKTKRARGVRRSRVVLTPRRWRQVRAGQPARATVANSPVTGESPEETVKTTARGMPGVSGVTVVTMLVCFFTFAHKAAGAPSARHSLRPLISRAGRVSKTRAHRAARSRSRGPTSLRGAKRRSNPRVLCC
jgi:hypothetical protein